MPLGHDRAPAKVNPPASIQLSRIEMAVDVASERYQTSQTLTSTDEQLDDKSQRSKFGSDLESAMENRV
jgi:hypothetical protein